MSARAKQWLIAYLRQPFVVIVWFMETFAANRARLKAFLTQPGTATTIRGVAVATFFVWLGVFAFLASDEHGERFTCAFKTMIQGEDLQGCEPTPTAN